MSVYMFAKRLKTDLFGNTFQVQQRT